MAGRRWLLGCWNRGGHEDEALREYTGLCGDASVPASLLRKNVGEGCDIRYGLFHDGPNLFHVTAHFVVYS